MTFKEPGVVDRTHFLITEGFNNFIFQIDDTLSGGEQVSDSPASTARVRIDFYKRGNQSTQLKGKIKVKAVLPRAEKKLRLLINTEEDLKPDVDGQTESNTDGLSLALRFVKRARDNGQLNFDLGGRWRDSKVQVFARANLSFDYYHGTPRLITKEDDSKELRFRSRLSNNLYQYSSSGFENRFRYDLSKTLGGQQNRVLRASTDLLWSDTRHGLLITETIGLYTNLDDKRALAYELIGSYTSRLNGSESDYYRGTEVRIRFRHNIFRDWFYYEFWPGISWNADNNYRDAFQALFRIETLIGKF